MDFVNKNGDNKLEPTINITSLIDVVLSLIMFFMITTHFKGAPSINIKLPTSSSKDVQTEKDLTIAIDKKGTVSLNDRKIDKDKLLTAIRDLLPKHNYKVAIVKADESVTHGTVVGIMDTIKEAGIERIAVAVETKK
ncbi:MAG: biopolymer transporter ExbD [bacterium]